MSTYHVETSHVIDARPDAIYHVLADYRVGHPAILPKPYFEELTVVQGGQGASTELRVRMKVFGQTYHYHQMVSEPEPGRVLKEAEVDSEQYTTFTVESLGGGQQTRVTIASEFPVKLGLTGMLERLMQPAFVRRLYQQELRNLADYLQRSA